MNNGKYNFEAFVNRIFSDLPESYLEGVVEDLRTTYDVIVDFPTPHIFYILDQRHVELWVLLVEVDVSGVCQWRPGSDISSRRREGNGEVARNNFCISRK